jgi:hypothetical protein
MAFTRMSGAYWMAWPLVSSMRPALATPKFIRSPGMGMRLPTAQATLMMPPACKEETQFELDAHLNDEFEEENLDASVISQQSLDPRRTHVGRRLPTKHTAFILPPA